MNSFVFSLWIINEFHKECFDALKALTFIRIICASVNQSYDFQFRFSINPNTGAISVSAGLDRETLANYKLTIRASDGGSPPLSSKKNVPIKVLDVNDNAPIFTSRSYSGLISEDAAVGSRVVQVSGGFLVFLKLSHTVY